MATTDWYARNPLVHRDRRPPAEASAWVRSFACDDMGILVICRGPIRKEAIDVFREMGVRKVGMLLSEKDSIVYTNALAPEVRFVPPDCVHHVVDYTGATKEEREERIREIVGICRENGYGHVFAGYGFMAEDELLVSSLEAAGLTFVGPGSHVVRAAGAKDEAKKTALEQSVSVTPGINDVAARTLLAKHATAPDLRRLADERGLAVAEGSFEDTSLSLPALAERVLAASYADNQDLFTIDELGQQVKVEVARLLADNPGSRVRLKAIGGGGGKGQRILASADEAPEKAREVLSEVKATGVGDNKNMLIELNVEQTRHHEIQLLGNGSWAISLGGRDCSLQMHEQKLLEVSITQEGLQAAIEEARARGAEAEERALQEDLTTLGRMEAEAERFGAAVGLDSASTFECIVDRGRHYFMEVNTRIQVEHRVSELCYGLRFANPEDPSDFFEVHSLVEAMALLARHGKRLPKPVRVRRETAALEARLNATDRSLSPHAGGKIVRWSDPTEWEIRDDQGICVKNPDTGLFQHYRLAGAYDSNIALLVTVGSSRAESYRRLSQILRQTRLRGTDLATNLEFHHGLVHWFEARNVWAKPTTRFVVPYLCQVGLLKERATEVDLDHAWSRIARSLETRLGGGKESVAAVREVMARKYTLVTRPIVELLAEPHHLSAWLSVFQDDVGFEDGRLVWRRNPLSVLEGTYHLLDMEPQVDEPAAYVIWPQDQALLEDGLAFYRALAERLGVSMDDWSALVEATSRAEAPEGFDDATWERVRAAHVGFAAGVEALGLLARIGAESGFFELRVRDDLEVEIPERLLAPGLYERMKKVLVPPPRASSDTIVAVSGGMFYAREAPDLPPMVKVGDHFEAGDPLYIVEVMKMFNKVRAPFAGTIRETLVDGGDGCIVAKGQPLFRVEPDEAIVGEDAGEVERRRRERTDALLDGLI